MATVEYRSSVPQWMFFIGVLMLLMGVYGLLRMIHISARSVPYPAQGVFPSNILFSNNQFFNTYSRESECEPLPQLYYDYGLDGKTTPRTPTEEEKMNEERQMSRCINGFEEDRAKQRQRDKNQAIFLVFLGVGLVFSRRFIDRTF
jgi:hypothetical protein